jgi:hypothetical protein
VRDYCIAHQIDFDIECDDASRIYGQKWYKFISSMRAMLGTESGSNIFDWDLTLREEIEDYQRRHPKSTHEETYFNLLRDREIDGLMNQISPKIFEMAAAKTAMILLDGEYSGILQPHIHFFPLKKDYSNLGEIITLLKDDDVVNAMVERAYKDVIFSGKFSYRKFVLMVDIEIDLLISALVRTHTSSRTVVSVSQSKKITSFPIRYKRSTLLKLSLLILGPHFNRVRNFIWALIPVAIKPLIKKIVLKFL